MNANARKAGTQQDWYRLTVVPQSLGPGLRRDDGTARANGLCFFSDLLAPSRAG